MDLRGKTVVVTGASRGIGREIALKCAREGANVVVAAKSEKPNPKLPGTILTVCQEIREAGGQCLALKVDVRQDEAVAGMIEKTVQAFGGLDVLVNNAGAIYLASLEKTPMKRFDLMNQVNVRATFHSVQAALPFLKKSPNPHVLNISPPISEDRSWYGSHLGYTLSKYAMTMCTFGMSLELKGMGIAVNSLWPKRLIATAATQWLMGEEATKRMRNPAIMADAVHAIINTPALQLTGQTLLDEDFLRSRGVCNFDVYSVTPSEQSPLDLFVNG